MPDVPIPVDLAPGRVVGILGDRGAGLALARSLLLQMVTHHGPADLFVAVGTDWPQEWRWTAWLPHTADQVAGRRGIGLLSTPDLAGAAAVLDAAGERAVFALLDGDDPFQGRTTVGRHLLGSNFASALVLAPDEHRLPARCDELVRVDAVGRLLVVDPRRSAQGGGRGLAWGISRSTAAMAAAAPGSTR